MVGASTDLQPDCQCLDLGCVMLDKLFNFFVPEFPHLTHMLQHNNCAYLVGCLLVINELMHTKLLK